MAFGWAYVDCTGSAGGGGGTGGASGPRFSIQFMTASGEGVSSGSANLTYHYGASSRLVLTGALSVSGTISASHYHIENVVEMDVSGNTFFGNTNGDTHARTGSLIVTNEASDINLKVDRFGRTYLRQLMVEYTPITTSPYTASHPIYILGVQATGSVNILLPRPDTTELSGNIIMIKDEQVTTRGGHNITLKVDAGKLIDGATSYVLTGSMPAISLYSNGVNWFVF